MVIKVKHINRNPSLLYSESQKDTTPDFDAYLEKYGDSDTALFRLLVDWERIDN